MSTQEREGREDPVIAEQSDQFLASARRGEPCSCAELRDHLYEFLDSELDDSERERLDRHVTNCPDCTEAAEAEHHIRMLLRNACAEQAPQGLRARVVAQLTVLRTSRITYRA